MPDEPIIDLQSDHYFMGEALRQARRAYHSEEVPVGAVVVREGRIIGRAFNQVELLKDATAHAEGRFEFFPCDALKQLSLPQTDREQIWPLFWRHRGGFFAAHCHCHANGRNEWTIQESSVP